MEMELLLLFQDYKRVNERDLIEVKCDNSFQ
jgi:hypothetical protein